MPHVLLKLLLCSTMPSVFISQHRQRTRHVQPFHNGRSPVNICPKNRPVTCQTFVMFSWKYSIYLAGHRVWPLNSCYFKPCIYSDNPCIATFHLQTPVGFWVFPIRQSCDSLNKIAFNMSIRRSISSTYYLRIKYLKIAMENECQYL
jgi:hypothetical protein